MFMTRPRIVTVEVRIPPPNPPPQFVRREGPRPAGTLLVGAALKLSAGIVFALSGNVYVLIAPRGADGGEEPIPLPAIEKGGGRSSNSSSTLVHTGGRA